MGLVLRLHCGEGFSLRHKDNEINVIVTDFDHYAAAFEFEKQEIAPIMICYDDPYRIESFPETTFVSSRGEGKQIKVNINAPKIVKIRRLGKESNKPKYGFYKKD